MYMYICIFTYIYDWLGMVNVNVRTNRVLEPASTSRGM